MQIAKTSGRSEEAQRDMQRNTMTYRTIQAIGELQGMLSTSRSIFPA